jgi:hypothetical protein
MFLLLAMYLLTILSNGFLTHDQDSTQYICTCSFGKLCCYFKIKCMDWMYMYMCITYISQEYLWYSFLINVNTITGKVRAKDLSTTQVYMYNM